MRNILYLFVFVILFSACEDVVEPSSIIQGEVNETLFRSNSETAFINEAGELIIQGSNVDAVRLKTNASAVGLYEISPNSGNSASFVSDGNTFITAGPNSGGMIEIEEITNAYVTGNFYFEARRNGVGERLNFSKGTIWRVPFSNADIPINDENPDVENVLEATVNGSNLNILIVIGMQQGNSILFSGTTASQTSIAISIPNPTEVGEYVFGQDEGFEASYQTPEGIEFATDGNIDVISFNETLNSVAGTCNFTTDEGSSITNGEFVIYF